MFEVVVVVELWVVGLVCLFVVWFNGFDCGFKCDWLVFVLWFGFAGLFEMLFVVGLG